MKLIKKLIEDAAAGAVGAGAVAGHAMPLFARLTKRELPVKIRVTKKTKPKKVDTKGLGIKESFHKLYELDDAHMRGQNTFDTTEVISKLKSLENKDSVDKGETQAFVLEDDDGNMVKIWVRADQAANFEAALNAFLADEDTDETRGIPEIAEVLFKLKDRFDIVDVEWPDVQEDEEQEVALAGDQAGAEGMPGAEGEMGAEGELDLGDDAAMGGGEEEVKSLLTQVIDMMKADAEARKAEAHAKAAEAKAREAALATQQVYAKVKQEEQILDMEAEQKKQKEAEKEAKRLAQLARWKHEMEKDEGATFDSATPDLSVAKVDVNREEEEMHRPAHTAAQPGKKGGTIRGRVSPADVASYILNRVK